ncbi:hypothetical protein DYB37_003038 [Aphanomyces astaci]|uniref:Uncharacterized protein n=1 Tax=Aphanomyces astaci TaxID=112090 RepID=A0A3R6XVQ8_APHAT|nr:hypothetical protein DYB35_003101 [Aphanomyces astaci]RHZ33666.1 hypothetical protein DYB37_003038 [Aphanomyces astaci]
MVHTAFHGYHFFHLASTLADALRNPSIIRHANLITDSYPVLIRPDPQTTLPDTQDTYDAVYSAIALAIDGILHACQDQSYHPAADNLKVNIAPDATSTVELPSALPILSCRTMTTVALRARCSHIPTRAQWPLAIPRGHDLVGYNGSVKAIHSSLTMDCL